MTIDLDNPDSVDYWTKELNCTETQLHAAVAAVGNQVADVRRQLDFIPSRKA
jgi:hypothetical protein